MTDHNAPWRSFEETPPPAGAKIAIVCNDGCSSSLALVTDDGVLDGEDGFDLSGSFCEGAIWTMLPTNYPLCFMEYHDDY